MKTTKLAVASIVAALAMPAFAGDFYAGIGVGSAKMSDLDSAANAMSQELINTFGATTSVPTTDDDTSVSLFGGYRINPNLAVEIAYADLGDQKAAIATDYTVLAESDALKYSPTALALDLVASMSPAKDLTLGIKAGYARLKVKHEHRFDSPSLATTTQTNGSVSSGVVHYGLMASYDVTQSVALRVDYEVFKDVKFASPIGLAGLGTAGELKSDVRNVSVAALMRF